MITERVLARAVAEEVITSVQADALRRLAAEDAPAPVPEPVDDERLRFVSGFADIFVTMGLALFLGSLAYLANRAGLGMAGVGALAAAAAWALAEFFTRRRRMALPSIVLLIVFAGSAFVACAGLFGATAGRPIPHRGLFDSWLGPSGGYRGALAGVVAAGLVALHYWRFRVPISLAALVAVLATAGLSLLAALWPAATDRALDLLVLAFGLATFGLAMRFDLADPARRTRQTDIAFWLHLMAAPLIVHSVFGNLGISGDVGSPGMAAAILAILAALALVALVIDRRAILVSGLTYGGVALGSLIRQLVSDGGLVTPLSLLGLGAFVLLLSAGWHPLRRQALRLCSPGLVRRLPPAA